MSKENDGGPAFPRDHAHEGHNGMSLRDYFAAKALSGFLANPQQDYAPLITGKLKMLAEEAYRLADAMLAAREEVR